MVASRKSTWAKMALATAPWWAPKRPTRASFRGPILGRMRDRAMLASTTGSRSPAMRASTIALVDLPRTVDATEESLMPASWSTLSSRWISEPARDLRLPKAGEIAELPNLWRWHEARADHPVGCDIGQPLGGGEVGLAPGDVLHVLCVTGPQLVDQILEA